MNTQDIPTSIDIGCGENKRTGFLGLDFRTDVSVDIIADASMLPFRDESFDHVFQVIHLIISAIMRLVAFYRNG